MLVSSPRLQDGIVAWATHLLELFVKSLERVKFLLCLSPIKLVFVMHVKRAKTISCHILDRQACL
jgi:hypothetical protein